MSRIPNGRATHLHLTDEEHGRRFQSYERLTHVVSDAGLRRHAFTTQVCTMLSSCDPSRYHRELVELAVPRFADWGFVEDLDDEGEVRICAEAHALGRGLADELRRRRPFDGGSPYGICAARASRRSTLLHDMEDAITDHRTSDPEDLQIYATLGVQSALFVPFVVDSNVEAVLSLFSLKRARRFDAQDLQAMKRLACEVSTALGQAQRYDDDRERSRASLRLLNDAARHELRTPVSALLLQLEDLETRLEGDHTDPEAIRSGVTRALAQTRRLKDRLEDVTGRDPDAFSG